MYASWKQGKKSQMDFHRIAKTNEQCVKVMFLLKWWALFIVVYALALVYVLSARYQSIDKNVTCKKYQHFSEKSNVWAKLMLVVMSVLHLCGSCSFGFCND